MVSIDEVTYTSVDPKFLILKYKIKDGRSWWYKDSSKEWIEDSVTSSKRVVPLILEKYYETLIKDICQN